VAAWVYCSSGADNSASTICSENRHNAFDNQFVATRLSSTNWDFFWRWGNTQAFSNSHSFNLDNKWVLLVGVSVSDTDRRIHLRSTEGFDDVTATGGSGPTTDSTTRFQIGSWNRFGPREWWQEQIAEIRIYRGALSESQVTDLWCHPLDIWENSRLLVAEAGGGGGGANLTQHYYHTLLGGH
jgi:hypothetical protein